MIDFHLHFGNLAREGYPKTPPLSPEQLLDFMDRHGIDIGANAMARDPEFARGFVQRHWRRMLWASDYCIVHQHIPQLAWIAGLDVTTEIRDAIVDGNARRLLGLGGAEREIHGRDASHYRW